MDVLYGMLAAPNIQAPSYTILAVEKGGSETTWAEYRKHQQYSCLDTHCMFTPVAVETMCAETLPILKDVGQCLKQVSGEASVFSQRLSVAVLQLGNCVSVLGSIVHKAQYVTRCAIKKIFWFRRGA